MILFVAERAIAYMNGKNFFIVLENPLDFLKKEVYNTLTTEQTGACIQAERKV